MIIKTPAAYDVSHWKEIPDFKLVDPRPTLFITKATEGTSIVDAKFPRFFAGMREIGCKRGVYHFFRRVLDPVKQAGHFCNTIRPHVVKSDILILDMEEGGERASQLWAWFETVCRSFPNNLLVIYSTAGLLNAIPMTAAEKEYFRRIPVWTGGYPWFPDLYPSVPSSYIPDQSKWGPVYLWQYSAHGKVAGIQGDVDLNLISPAFMAMLDGDVILPPIAPPPAIPPEPEAQLWNATVMVDGLFIRSYPVVTEATKTVYHANTNEKFTGRLWVGNGYVWMKIETATRPELPGRWAAVRTERYPLDGTRQLISLTKAVSAESSGARQLYQVKHDIELGPLWRPGMPEVFRLEPFQHVVLTEPIQWLWRKLNPGMTPVKFCKLFGNRLAFTNASGFPGHANYILGEELDRDDPRFDQARICGGAVVCGVEQDDHLLLETIDTTNALPSAEWVLQRPWLYFHAVVVGSDGSIGMFPQGEGSPVLVPLLSSQPARYPLSKLRKLPPGAEIPGPYR